MNRPLEANTLDDLDDEQLTSLARLGDPEAFNLLLARHRSKAFAWAKQISADSHLAEDIVQEALIRAFMKLGTLVDASKFVPWLKTIVRNQAMMKLRRGGPYRNERPLSGYIKEMEDGEPDFANLDTVLHHMAKQTGASPSTGDVVAAAVLDAHLPETMTALIRSLGPRERQVFEQHFYGQLTPQEIADHYNTNVNSVHKMISRIRKKITDEKIEIDLRGTIRAHCTERGMRTIILNKPGLLGDKPVHPDMAIPTCLYHLLPYAGDRRTMTYVMGFSGYAFLLNVLTGNIGPGGPMLWDWNTFIANGLKNLGFHSRYVDYQHYRHAPDSPHKTRKLLFTLDMIKESVDGGLPAYLNNGLHYEGSLVYGYDDANQLLHVMDSRADTTIPYTHLYYGNSLVASATSKELYAYSFAKMNRDEAPALKLLRLLERIVQHAEGKDPTFTPCTNGLQAYDVWIRAFENKTVDPLGNASCLAVYGWCREHAAQFWTEQLACWADEPRYREWLVPLMQQAELRYAAVADAFRKLQARFPFPGGGNPSRPGEARLAEEWLLAAKTDETAAVRAVAEMARLLRSELERDTITAGQTPVHVPIHPFYSFGRWHFEPETTEPADAIVDSVVVACSDLKRSLHFYCQLLGLRLLSDMEDVSVGVLPLQSGANLVLMDARLDLLHTDWRPNLVVRCSNITAMFAEAKQRGWNIVYPLDRGAVYMHFFVAADPDGNQLLVTTSPLPHPSVQDDAGAEAAADPAIDRICMPVKDTAASLCAYNLLFGSGSGSGSSGRPWLDANKVELRNKFGLSRGDTRLSLRTGDLDKTRSRLKEMGVPLLYGPDELGDGSFGIVIHDPDKHSIAIRLK